MANLLAIHSRIIGPLRDDRYDRSRNGPDKTTNVTALGARIDSDKRSSALSDSLTSLAL
jgi:hypothetical protein